MALTQTQVSQLYVAIFNRASEGEGNTFWQKAGTKVEAANSMLDTQDAKDYFGTSINSNQAFIETIYKNTLNKTLADDPAGIAFWTAALDSGMSRGEVVSSLIDAIESYKNDTNPKTKAAYDQFNNRVQVSDYMAKEVTTAPKDYKTSTQFAPLGTLNVDNTATSVSTAKNTVDNMIVIDGKTFALTAGADNFTGSEKNDVFNAYDVGDAVVKQTLNAVDQLDGGAGKDILNVSSDTAIAKVNANITNIETINLRSGSSVTFDTTNYTGVETLNVKQGTVISATAGEKTDINVSGATGAITTANGKNINITDSTANNAIASSGAAGTITVTDTNQGTGTITVNDGTDVTITASSLKNVAAGAITVGTTKAATGDVKITQNNISDGTAVASNGTITVTGGKTVDVTVNSTTTAKDATASSAITNGNVAVTSDGKTTTVTVSQNSTVTEFVTPETALVNGKTAITFKAMTAGQALSIDGLSFHATKDLTAAEVAAAFANLTALDTQANGGTTANGYYTGALATAGLTTGAANGAVVEFISVNQTPVAFTTGDYAAIGAGKMVGYLTSTNAEVNAIEPAAPTTTAGTAFSAESKTTNAVTYGDVAVNEKTAVAASITTVTLDGFKDAALGGTNALNALTTLSIANSAGTTTLDTTKTTLTLNVDNITNAVDLDGSAVAITTLTINANGEDSDFNLTATKVETLTIAAAADLDLDNTSTLSVLKTVTITGAGDVTLGDVSATLETLTASASTGAISAQVDGTKATVTTGAGDDVITVDTTTVTKAIDLGAGDDILDLSALTTLTGLATISGGTGTDTLVLDTTRAFVGTLSSVPNSDIIKSKITGFEKLGLKGAIGADGTVNVGNLGYNYVITSALAANYDLTLADMANNGTVELNSIAATASASDGVIVNLKDATTGATDVLNVVLNAEDAAEEAGILTVANVETINISTVDLDADEDLDAGTTLTLVATSAKTVNVTGNADLDLVMTGNTAATLIDASTMTGDLTVTASNASMTVKGGAGDDTITIAATADGSKFYGNGGNDTFIIAGGADLITIDGGADADTFVFNGVSTNKSNFVVLNNVDSGDTLDLALGAFDATAFNSTKITLSVGATESTQAYLDQAMTVLSQGQVGWFQYNGNTYVTADVNNSTNSFLDGTDFVVMITGLKDLSTASFNATDDTLEIA